MSTPPAAVLEDVSVVRDGRRLLTNVSVTVGAGERWVVLGPNGSGKTTLLKVLGAIIHPSAGRAQILGHDLARTDIRALRVNIGMTSGAIRRQLRPGITAGEIVLSGRKAALETWWHEYDDADRAAAQRQLQRNDLTQLEHSTFDVLSEGERQRTLLARALVSEPKFLLLDEPFAGLDMGARERLLRHFTNTLSEPHAPPTVLVTHHVEEIPPDFTHALLLRDGAVVAAGSIDETLTSDRVSTVFDLRLQIERGHDGRYRVA